VLRRRQRRGEAREDKALWIRARKRKERKKKRKERERGDPWTRREREVGC
jgi:hypothetical protein